MNPSDDKEPQGEAWPRGIAAISLFVEDLQATKAYYEKAFGLAVIFEDGDSAVFRFGTTLVNLLVATAAPELIAPARVASLEAGSRCVFTLEVENVDAKCAELAAHGITPLNGPWGPRTASFMDPAGHIWEIAS